MDNTLRIYAITRNDIEMTAGKLAAQAGHAYLDAYLETEKSDPLRCNRYYNGGSHGTKVCLQANLEQIKQIEQKCKELNIPHILVIDSGHIMPPHFTGEPIITALGIGPVYRDEAPFLKDLLLV